jgi:hypothetical protein
MLAASSSKRGAGLWCWQGVDSSGVPFGNGSTIHDVLGGILQGAMKGIVLGQVMQ